MILLSKYGSLLCFLAFATTTCNNNEICPDCSMQPELFRLTITNSVNSTDLIYSGYYDPNSIAIFYVHNDQSNFVDIEIDIDSVQHKAIVWSHEISRRSEDGFKDFFLYLNSQDTDTIFFDAEKTPNDCCPFYSLNGFKINNEDVDINTSENVFNFIKQVE